MAVKTQATVALILFFLFLIGSGVAGALSGIGLSYPPDLDNMHVGVGDGTFHIRVYNNEDTELLVRLQVEGNIENYLTLPDDFYLSPGNNRPFDIGYSFLSIGTYEGEISVGGYSIDNEEPGGAASATLVGSVGADVKFVVGYAENLREAILEILAHGSRSTEELYNIFYDNAAVQRVLDKLAEEGLIYLNPEGRWSLVVEDGGEELPSGEFPAAPVVSIVTITVVAIFVAILWVYWRRIKRGKTSESPTSGARRTVTGVYTEIPPENIENEPPTYEVLSITPEENATIEVENTAITKLTISVKNSVENVHVTVQELAERPATIEIAAPGITYAYLNIVAEHIIDAYIDRVTITFKVEKSWIREHEIDETTITLKRYAAGEWTSLPTEKVDEDDTYVYFSAVSPGLSVFAISGTTLGLGIRRVGTFAVG